MRIYAEYLETRNADQFVDLWRERNLVGSLTPNEAEHLAKQLKLAASRARKANGARRATS